MPFQTKKCYYLWGWSGNLNAGDDVFLYVTAWGLRKYKDAGRLFMDGDISGRSSELAGVETAEPRRWRVPGSTRLRRRWFRHLADHFVVAGGSLFTTEEGTAAFLGDAHWDQRGKSRLALSISVGPFRSTAHERFTVELLNSFRTVAFRDDFSYDWAVEAGVKSKLLRAFDLAVLLPLATARQSCPGSRKMLGVSLLTSGLLSKTPTQTADLERAKRLGKALADLTKNGGWKVRVFALCAHPYYHDGPVSEALAACFDPEQVEVYVHQGDARETFDRICECSHMLAMRLHGCILAYAADIPLFMIDYHAKCTEFGRTVQLSSDCIVKEQDLESPEFLRLLRKFISSNRSQTQLPLQKAQDRAMLNFTDVDL